MRALLAVGVFLAWGSNSMVAQQGGAPTPPRTPVAFLNLINASGLAGNLSVEFNNKAEDTLEIPLSGDTGMNELLPGTIALKISHANCPKSEEQKLTLKANERLNVVVHAITKIGENGTSPTTRLALLPLQHLPSPGKNTLSLLNCDALGQLQTLALNGVEQLLPPLQPVHLKELAPAASYALTFKGTEVMAPYEPMTQDHAYLVVYTNLESPRLEGVVVTDRKPGTQEEEMELKKKEIAKRIERERKAAEWVLKELDRKTRERTEARAQRQKQRAAELKR